MSQERGHSHKKIESFSDINPGMKVLFKDCSWCNGKNHHGIILSFHKNMKLTGPTGKATLAPECALFYPTPLCMGGGDFYITTVDIEDGIVFACVDKIWNKEKENQNDNPYIDKPLISVKIEGLEELRAMVRDEMRNL